MSIVYVVTSGIYSDQQVVGVYDDKALAGQVAALLRDGEVLELELNTEADKVQQGLKPFRVDLTDEGGKAEVFAARGFELDEDGREYQGVFDTECWARDEAHAVKIASDRRAIYRANQPAPKPPTEIADLFDIVMRDGVRHVVIGTTCDKHVTQTMPEVEWLFRHSSRADALKDRPVRIVRPDK